MSTYKGKPSEPGKGEGTGIPSVSWDKELTNENTDDDKKLAERIRIDKSNTDKSTRRIFMVT